MKLPKLPITLNDECLKEEREEKQFLNQIDLARRWGISQRTLERWRWQGEGGPLFVKIGNRVRYRIGDVKRYEQQYLMTWTGQQVQNDLLGGVS